MIHQVAWNPNFFHRLVEENNSEELSVTDMTELELELDAALVQTRLRKVIVRRYLFNLVTKAISLLLFYMFWIMLVVLIVFTNLLIQFTL